MHPVHSYRLHRYEGQYLYLKSAQLGLFCFIIGLILAYGFHTFLPDWLNPTAMSIDAATVFLGLTEEDAKKPAVQIAWFAQISLLTLFAAYLLKLLSQLSLYGRFGQWNAKIYVVGEILEDSPLDNLLYRISLDREKYAMLAMTDRKVYVGKVISLGEPSATKGMDQDIVLIPLMSGYRDKDCLKVNFKTFYGEVDADISICLRQENIVSATEFDFTAYTTWNPPKEAAASETGVTGELQAKNSPSLQAAEHVNEEASEDAKRGFWSRIRECIYWWTCF